MPREFRFMSPPNAADMESGKVQGIPLEETLAKARKIAGQ
jgi:hypothetical protein